MKKESRIYIAGHRGMVGSAIYRKLQSEGFVNLIKRTHSELNLTRQAEVEAFFEKEKPEYIFLAAARVGGILANNTYPAEFIYQNLQIQNNVIHCAFQCGVKKFLFLGSSCIYPKECLQPMQENYLLNGPLEPTNEAYAIAKIAGIKMCQFYCRQYGTNFIAIMPSNLYGPGDNFDLKNSHVLSALLRKFHEGKEQKADSVTLWGTGIARREFLHVDDLADASLFIMETVDAEDIHKQGLSHINVGTGKDMTIKELAEMIREIVGYTGNIVYDTGKPDGMIEKRLDVSILRELGWQYKTSLKDGIRMSYEWYLENLAES